MKELVEVIAKALVDHPEEVSVNEKNEGRTIAVSYTHLIFRTPDARLIYQVY